MSPDQALIQIAEAVESGAPGTMDSGMVSLLTRLLANNISQIDYVSELHGGPYPDAGHAERFIGVGIGFKEVHLRNLTYFAHLDTVEEGAPDLDVGVKIFKGLNVSHDLPIPVVIVSIIPVQYPVRVNERFQIVREWIRLLRIDTQISLVMV